MVYPRYAGFDSGSYVNQAHNDWLQWAAEGGLPFAILLAIFALLLWKPAVQSIYGLGTVAFLLHALVDYPMQQRPALGAWFFALAGAAWARQSSRDRNEPPPLRSKPIAEPRMRMVWAVCDMGGRTVATFDLQRERVQLVFSRFGIAKLHCFEDQDFIAEQLLVRDGVFFQFIQLDPLLENKFRIA